MRALSTVSGAGSNCLFNSLKRHIIAKYRRMFSAVYIFAGETALKVA